MYIGCPLLVRADPGTENPDVARMQMFLRRHGQDERAGEGSFIYGKSTNNQVFLFYLTHIRNEISF